jgi:AraC-like DNA-binding protein
MSQVNDSWTRVTRKPDTRLAPLLARDYIGVAHHATHFESWLEPPSASLTLMISLEDPLRTGRGTLPKAWIAGLDDRPELVETGGRLAEIDLRLTPLGAYRLCGMPLHELRGEVVNLGDVFGHEGRLLASKLEEREDWQRRFDLVEQFLLRRAGQESRPDPLVAEAWTRLQSARGNLRIGTLATQLGASRRHLTTRFREQLGLPPKAVARLLRFEDVRRRLTADPVRWIDIAIDCGYADQSHLNRDFRELAGTTPSDFLARQVSGGGTIGDGITFLQDAPTGAA